MRTTGKRGKPSKRVRLEDIARHCGVSLSTVSRALAGEKGVRPEIRAKVIAMAQTQNYAMPVSLAGRKVILAASSDAMIDYVRNQFTYHVLEGLNSRAKILDVEIVTQPIGNSEDDFSLLEKISTREDVAGFLFLTLDEENILTLINRLKKPAVLINGDDPLMRLSSVTPCNRSASRMAANYLAKLGHRKIAFMMRRGRRTIERRYEGWRDALVHIGCTDISGLVMEVDDWLPELATRAIGKHIKRHGLNFSAILAAGDSLAAGAMLGLQQAGYNVPADVSVMGMDDLPQAAFCNPPLSTIHIPMHEIGAAALDLLLGNLGGLPSPTRRVELACHIVKRSSAALKSNQKKFA